MNRQRFWRLLITTDWEALRPSDRFILEISRLDVRPRSSTRCIRKIRSRSMRRLQVFCVLQLFQILMVRSPTCTGIDRVAAEELAELAKINIEELAQDMFQAGSNLKGKTAEEICFQDFKKFTVGDVTFGVGQINSMSRDELQEIKSKLLPYMEKARQAQQVDMVFFMLTNIIQESTELLCCGNGAREQVLEAFDLSDDIEDILLKGVVSRKKQLIPAFVISLQQ